MLRPSPPRFLTAKKKKNEEKVISAGCDPQKVIKTHGLAR
jgi:hypothetical protein